MGGNQVLGFLVAFTLQKADPHQLFNGSGTGSRCAQSLTLCFFGHFICTGGFHGVKQGILGVMFGWGGFALFDLSSMDTQSLTGQQLWENRFLFFLLVTGDKLFPSHLHHLLAFGGERYTVFVQLHLCFSVAIGFAHGTKQTGTYQLQYRKFSFGQLTEVAFLQFSGGKNGMVVGNLLVIDDLPSRNGYSFHASNGKGGKHQLHQSREHICHIAGQVSTVGAGISDQLFFVEVLGVIQCLLCRIAQHTVGISL